jgi:hypothetical protein
MEQDLRALLTSVRDDAPPPRLSVDDITAAGRHLARRRRRLTLMSSVGGGVVTAVAAVAAAVILASSPPQLAPAVDRSAPPKPASPVPTAFPEAQPFETSYEGYEAGPYAVGDPNLVTAAYQQSPIDAVADLLPGATDGPDVKARAGEPGRGGIMVVYRPGAFEPAVFGKGSEKITVRSGVALLMYAGGSAAPPLSKSEQNRLTQMQPRVPTLAWQYTENAWAAIYWSSWETVPEREDLVAIADGFKPSGPKRFPVGFQVGYLPKDLELLSVSYGSDMNDGGAMVSTARLSPGQPRTPLTEPYNFEELPSLAIGFGHTNANPKLVGKLECPSSTLCMRVQTDGSTFVQAELNGLRLSSNTQLSQVTLSITGENPQDMADWPAAVDVFP